jgi:hypothetical protein
LLKYLHRRPGNLINFFLFQIQRVIIIKVLNWHR